MDLNPSVTPNILLTDSLNGTLITYDGNEHSFQNDMGNYALKGTALNSGFIPVGMKSYGDIIYIASYNPTTKQCELGTYPSPKYPSSSELNNDTENQYYIENLELENNYKPLWNLMDSEGNRLNFTTELLNFDEKYPVNIEIQPSYDGSVNLILNDEHNEPRLINSGFSIYENRKVRLVKRDQKEATNIYKIEKFANQTRLKKVADTIPRFVLKDVLSTGQLKGGNYTFYLKMADGDYNKSDIIAESGQISIFKGNLNAINSIHGTLLDETTDKAIQLKIANIDITYPNFYILYSREYSDLNGVRKSEVFELTKAFEINDDGLTVENGENCFTIQIDGTEEVNQITESDLNIEYITIDSVKTQAQQQNMLFLGNITSTTTKYRALQKIAYKTKVTLCQNKTGVGWVNASYNTVTEGSEYYNPKNIYNYLGYWPEEYYRFAIVFIKEDDTLTPAFNVIGRAFNNIDETNEEGLSITDDEWETVANENYVLGSDRNFYNKNGIFKNPRQTSTTNIQNYNDENIYPWYYKFELNTEGLEDLGIKGYFVTRQKRVPTILCQGMSISIDKTSHTPMLYDPKFKPTQPSLELPRICNGEMFLIGDNTSDGHIEYKKATTDDKYFTESFLATFQDSKLYDDPFENENKNANWHEYLVTDGKSLIEKEKGDKKYTALGDHIIRTNVDHKQCSAILSLDPCVIPSLQSRMNGEERYLYPQQTLGFHAVLTSEKTQDEDPSEPLTPEQITTKLKVLSIKFETIRQGYLKMAICGMFIEGGIPVNPFPDYDAENDSWSNSAYIKDPSDETSYLIPEITMSKWITDCSVLNDVLIPYYEKTNNTEILEVLSGYKNIFTKEYGQEYLDERETLMNQILAASVSESITSGIGYIHGNVYYDGEPTYYTRAFQYDTLSTETDLKLSVLKNKVIFVNSGNASKAIPNPLDKEKTLVFTTQAGDPADISKTAIFGEGDEYRSKLYGAQFKWALRGIYCPILGIDDVGDDEGIKPFLQDNTIYNIYTDNYKPEDNISTKQWFAARSVDRSLYYPVTDRYALKTNSTDVYRGDCFSNTVTFRINRNFVDPDVPIVNEVLQYSSWAEHTIDGFNKTPSDEWDKINRADVNAVSLGMWVTFKCLSNYNLGIRSEDTQHTDETALMGNPRSFFPLAGISADCGQKIEESWLLNDGYNATVGRKNIVQNQNVPYQKTDYSNRIMFSNIAVTNSFSNGYRVFQGLSYRDVDNQYGEITKLVPWGNNLFCVFEHGCAIVPINEKALMQTTTQQSVHIYGLGVLPDVLTIISQDFGSIWADSIIRTPLGIYGVDSYAKKIWRYTDSKGFETISDMVIQRFLNDNLLVSESDKQTILTKQNIKTHYNAYKGDLLFCFYNQTGSWNICYNERMGIWVTRYSWLPINSENINNQFYTFDLEACQNEEDVNLYLHGRTGIFDEISYIDNNSNNQLKPTKWYGKQQPFEFEFVVKADEGAHKIFDNLIILSNNVQPESITFTLIGDTYLFNKARIYHAAKDALEKNIYGNIDDGFNKLNLRGTIANPYTPMESIYLKNTKIQYDPILDQYELVMTQETKNMESWGRRLGNIHYKEDGWYFVIDPIIYDQNINIQSIETTEPKWKTVPLRDKWMKIRIRYKGDQLALITAIITFYRLT